MQDRKKLKVEVAKPVEATTGPQEETAAEPQQNHDDPAKAEAKEDAQMQGEGAVTAPEQVTAGPVGAIKAEDGPGVPAATSGAEENEAAEGEEPEVSTESDENRPDKDIQHAESTAIAQPGTEEDLKPEAEPSDRDGKGGAELKAEQPTVIEADDGTAKVSTSCEDHACSKSRVQALLPEYVTRPFKVLPANL